MASGRAPGIYRLYIENPSGVRRLVKSADAAWWNVANLGSQGGVISTSATPDKWAFLPPSVDVGASGYKIVCTYTASAATTLDASDGVGIIPVIVNGQQQTLGMNGANGIGNDSFLSVLALADTAYVAGTETPAWIVRAVDGVTFRIGGDKVFMSLEDNA